VQAGRHPFSRATDFQEVWPRGIPREIYPATPLRDPIWKGVTQLVAVFITKGIERD